MTNWIKKLFQNQAIRYIFFGGCTTLVNLISYAIFRHFLGIDITIANFLSISLSILFAYVVNKIFVFESRTRGIRELLVEAGQFIGMRLSTMFIEIFGVVILCCVFGVPDMIGKLLIQVVVLVLNYVFSKCFVFKDKTPKEFLSPEELLEKKRIRRCAAFGFVIPAVVVAVSFAVNLVYPFGDHGVLIIDSLHQYLPFFTEFHEKLVNNESFLYSMGGGLGINFWATIAYYLASPMNFLLVLFPKRNMMDVMALFIVLKLGLCGCTFSWYLAYKEKGKSYFPVLFGTMYALSSFMIGYYFNLMWFDSIAMLPLVMLGIERIVKGGNGKMFCVSLFYALYCNYYIGFMLCLFSCLYLLVQWISTKGLTVKKFFTSALTFGWYALLSGGMAAIMLVPAFLGLGVTESAENKFPWPPKLYLHDASQLTSQFAFVEPINIADHQYELNAFCGVLTLVLAVLFLLDKYVSLRERIAKTALCVLLFMSFDTNILNFIWHGFHTQNGLPNRFAFLYIAMLLVMAHQALWHVRYLSGTRVLIAAAVPLAFTGYSWWTGLGDREFYVYLATELLLTVYGVLLLLYGLVKKAREEKLFKRVLVFIGVVEMAATAVYGVSMNGTVSRQTYLDDQIAYEKLMARNEDGSSFYRSDIDSTRMRNADMFMGGDGVMLFSSTMPASTVDLCKALGMEARTNKSGYVGLTKLFNDILGVKYVESRTVTDRLYQMEQVDYEEPLALYRNDNALSIGFMVDSDIKDWDIDSGNAADVQNEFVALAVNEGPLFTLNQSIEMTDGGSYDIVIPAGMQAYLEVTRKTEKITVSTPDYTKSYDKYNDHLYDLGCFDEDEIATVTCEFSENQEGSVTANVYICSDEEYQMVHDKLASSQLVTDSENGSYYVKDGKIRGTIDADQDGTLLFSLPYDTGWKVKVDGKTVETYAVGRSLLGIDLTEGSHEIALDYTAPGLWEGTILSILCLALFFLTLILENQRRLIQIPPEEGMEAAIPLARREEEEELEEKQDLEE